MFDILMEKTEKGFLWVYFFLRTVVLATLTSVL